MTDESPVEDAEPEVPRSALKDIPTPWLPAPDDTLPQNATHSFDSRKFLGSYCLHLKILHTWDNENPGPVLPNDIALQIT